MPSDVMPHSRGFAEYGLLNSRAVNVLPIEITPAEVGEALKAGVLLRSTLPGILRAGRFARGAGEGLRTAGRAALRRAKRKLPGFCRQTPQKSPCGNPTPMNTQCLGRARRAPP